MLASLSRMAHPPSRRFPSLRDLTPGQALSLDRDVLAASRKFREERVNQLLRDAKRRKASIETVALNLLAMIYIEGTGG